MKTDQKKKIIEHGQNLIEVFGLPYDTDPLKLCKSLRRLERKGEEIALNYVGSESDITDIKALTRKVAKLLEGSNNVPFFVNLDPRGYALKIDDQYTASNQLDIHKDWGGYGIIAPEIE